MTSSTAERSTAERSTAQRSTAQRSTVQRSTVQLGGLVLSYLAVPLASFAAAPILARALGPEGRGELAALQSVLLLVTVVVAAGMPEAFALVRGRQAVGYYALVRRHWMLVTGSCAVGVIAVLGLAPVFSGGSPAVADMLRATCWIVVPLVLIEVARGSCKGAARFGALRNEQVVIGFGRLAVLVLLLVTGTLTVGSAYAATVGTALVAGGFLLLAARVPNDGMERTPTPPPGRGAFRSLVTRFSVGTIAMQANIRLDQAILLPVVGAHGLGLYAVAAAFAQIVGTLFFGVRNFLYGRLVRDDSMLVFRVLRVLLMAQLLLVGVLMAAAGTVTDLLFGAEYDGGVTAMRVLLAGTVPINVSGLLTIHLATRDRAGRAALAEVLALVVTILGLLLVAPVYGVIGAAWVSVAAYSASATAMVVVTRRTSGVTLSAMFVPRRPDLSILCKGFR